MIAFNDSNNTHSSQKLISSSINQQQQDISASSSLQSPRLKTTINSSNVRRTTKSRKNHQLNSIVTDHRIGTWIIRESLQPFPEKENNSSSSSIKQQMTSNVQQWNIDDVCLFFEDILSKNCYTSIIQEHLIDGIALLLLKEEHLIKIFKMPLDSRMKLLNAINKL